MKETSLKKEAAEVYIKTRHDISRGGIEGLDEAKIHRFDQACAGHIDDFLPLGIVLGLADHREDFQHLALDELFGQLAVV